MGDWRTKEISEPGNVLEGLIYIGDQIKRLADAREERELSSDEPALSQAETIGAARMLTELLRASDWKGLARYPDRPSPAEFEALRKIRDALLDQVEE